IDSESNWVRYQVYHYLAKKMLDNRDPRSNEQLQEEKLYLEKQLKSAPPFLRKEFESKIEIINQILSSGNNDLREQSRATWQEIIDHIILSSDFKTLFYKISKGRDITHQNSIYAKALLFDQFARRIQR